MRLQGAGADELEAVAVAAEGSDALALDTALCVAVISAASASYEITIKC
jgi:hypothetical protein